MTFTAVFFFLCLHIGLINSQFAYAKLITTYFMMLSNFYEIRCTIYLSNIIIEHKWYLHIYIYVYIYIYISEWTGCITENIHYFNAGWMYQVQVVFLQYLKINWLRIEYIRIYILRKSDWKDKSTNSCSS